MLCVRLYLCVHTFAYQYIEQWIGYKMHHNRYLHANIMRFGFHNCVKFTALALVCELCSTRQSSNASIVNVSIASNISLIFDNLQYKTVSSPFDCVEKFKYFGNDISRMIFNSFPFVELLDIVYKLRHSMCLVQNVAHKHRSRYSSRECSQTNPYYHGMWTMHCCTICNA